jgi:predicted HAD superfamily Cof-like phosphohydrolase
MNLDFHNDIIKMNMMYDLPVSLSPKFHTTDDKGNPAEAIEKFHDILDEELDELRSLLRRLCTYNETLTGETTLAFLTELADLLGDIVVYCHSEALKYGIPLEEVLGIIMASNFSKLPDNGIPLKDERGKFLKGPNYWKPEERIRALLMEKMKAILGS